VPLKFAKRILKVDWRQKVLRGFAEAPFAILSKEEK
jgi:hypothetical protein